jgi:hypothetical protein
MNNFIKSIIEEKFASKAQQRYFYAQAGKGGKKGKKFAKLAKEFSDKTNFKSLPEKLGKEEEVDEIVDAEGNISHDKFPITLKTKGVTSNSTTDDVVKTGRGAMGSYGTTGVQNYRRYWGESDMSKALGADELLHDDDVDYEEAKDEFEELGIDDPAERDERAKQMGFDPNLPDDKIRLVENPRTFIEEYIESILKGKAQDNEIVDKRQEEDEEVEINDIVKKQIKSLKNSMKTFGLKPDHILKGLKDNNE